MKQRLALVNASLDEVSFRAGKASLTLSYLSDALENSYDITLLPAKAYHRNDYDSYEKEIFEKIKDINLVGISTDTFSGYYAKRLSKSIKIKYPEKSVIIGGSGVNSQASKIMIPDKVAKPIIVPQDSGNELIDIELVLTNLCPQGCGYCNSPKNQVPVQVEDYIAKINHDKKIRRIILYDNNPLHRLNFDRTNEFFTKFEKRFGYIPDSVFYCDPSLLSEKSEFNRIIAFLKRFKGRNNNLFFGRERPDETTIARIKRRVNGKLRTQEELDKERKGLLKLASMLSLPGKEGINFTLVLNYILTPFETGESINSLIKEVMQFARYRRVIIKSTLLWIFPGTELSVDYEGKYIPVEKFDVDLKFFNFDSLNYWKIGYENSIFLDLCNSLNCRLYFHAPEEYYSWYNISMIKLAGELSLGKYKGKETIEKIIKDLPASQKKILGKKILQFGGMLDKNMLYKLTENNLGKMMLESNKLFFNIPEEIANMMAKEFSEILEIKKKNSV